MKVISGGYIFALMIQILLVVMPCELIASRLDTVGNAVHVLTMDSIVGRQTKELTSHDRLRIMFRVNESKYDVSYMTNKSNVEQLRIILKRAQRIDSVMICSFASPEGPHSKNILLSELRGEEVRRVILSVANEEGLLINKDKIIVLPCGENWSGMRNRIAASASGGPFGPLLATIDGDGLLGEKKQAIRNIGYAAYRLLVRDVLPSLRSSEIMICYPNVVETAGLHLSEKIPSVAKLNPAPSFKPQREPCIRHIDVALKSNLLYDALMWTNYGVEVPLTIKQQQFSLNYDHQFSWWRWGKRKYEYANRYFQMGGEIRWWFLPTNRTQIKRDNLCGHFTGLYFMGGKYEFQWRRKWCYLGEFWSTGLTYGYALPVSRHLNVEFAVSAGYAPIAYRHFIPADDYSRLYVDRSDMGTHHYIGITKLSISLVVPLSFKYKTRRSRR